MNDLISRSALIEYLEKVTVTEGITFETGFKQILTDIKNQPTVEAKPVEWIPCSERLPKEAGDYFVTLYNGNAIDDYCDGYRVEKRFFDDKGWWDDIDDAFGWNLIAWMPLPASYKEDMRGGKNE